MILEAELVVTNNTFLRQYESEIDSNLVAIEYSIQAKNIYLSKLKFPDSDSIEKLEEAKNQFIYTVLKEIKDSDLYRVVPTSKEIIKFFRKNRQFKSLLPAGIRI
jgi:hypothetical protein